MKTDIDVLDRIKRTLNIVDDSRANAVVDEPVSKGIGQMNRAELLTEAKRIGLFFDKTASDAYIRQQINAAYDEDEKDPYVDLEKKQTPITNKGVKKPMTTTTTDDKALKDFIKTHTVPGTTVTKTADTGNVSTSTAGANDDAITEERDTSVMSYKELISVNDFYGLGIENPQHMGLNKLREEVARRKQAQEAGETGTSSDKGAGEFVDFSGYEYDDLIAVVTDFNLDLDGADPGDLGLDELREAVSIAYNGDYNVGADASAEDNGLPAWYDENLSKPNLVAAAKEHEIFVRNAYQKNKSVVIAEVKEKIAMGIGTTRKDYDDMSKPELQKICRENKLVDGAISSMDVAYLKEQVKAFYKRVAAGVDNTSATTTSKPATPRRSTAPTPKPMAENDIDATMARFEAAEIGTLREVIVDSGIAPDTKAKFMAKKIMLAKIREHIIQHGTGAAGSGGGEVQPDVYVTAEALDNMREDLMGITEGIQDLAELFGEEIAELESIDTAELYERLQEKVANLLTPLNAMGGMLGIV